MSYPQARLTDTTSHGGTIITGAMKTMVDGLPAARMGDKHVCPIQGHGMTSIITGSLKTMIEGKPAARLGDMTACGATIVTASLKAVVN